MKSKTLWQVFASFGTGSHWFQVQVERFWGTERGDRATYFQEMKDEEHFLLDCSHYQDIMTRCADLFTAGLNISREGSFQEDHDSKVCQRVLSNSWCFGAKRRVGIA